MALSSVGPENKRRQQHESPKGSNTIGETSSSTERWNDVPHGTMGEVSSHVRLDLPFTARPPQRLFHLVLGSHNGRALVPIPKRSANPWEASTLQCLDSLKVLDPNRPIREADITRTCADVCFWVTSGSRAADFSEVHNPLIQGCGRVQSSV